MRPDGAESPLMTVADLAHFLSLAPRTVKNKLIRHPDQLPPPIRLPGLRGPRWVHAAVIEWVARNGRIVRRRGRPRKTGRG